MQAKLYIVPTPIGNFNDMTFRAVEVLKDVDLILAEDTRKTGILLKHFDIQNKMSPYHKFNEHKVSENIVNQIKTGKTIALVSDAGTPGISDPGYFLIRACVDAKVDIETLPGATAFVPALVNSGLPCDKFWFEGFLPHKKGRQKRFKELVEKKVTIVLYESPFRLLKTLEQTAEYFGNECKVSVSRELTKIYEENIKGTVAEVIDYYKNNTIKGEIVIIIGGK